MGETAKFLHQIDHALAVSGSGKRCNARVMFGSASDLFELGCATGCDDIPLQVSPGPLRAHVGLLCFEGFSLGYSLANRDLVFEQKDVGPTLCLHTDYNSFDLNVMDRPSLQVRPAGRPSVCLIFHDDFALADEVRSDWPNLHRSVEDLWASVDKIFSPDHHHPATNGSRGLRDVVIDSSEIVTILSAFRCALRTSGSQEQSLAPESMIEALRISKQYECSRVDFVAQKMRMTTRNLNYRSVKELGMSPKKLIKSAALRDAMISITSCSKTGKAIGDIAFENGFESFSRFSADYRMLFGERPSATYRRYFRE